jgi:hypothetical protein
MPTDRWQALCMACAIASASPVAAEDSEPLPLVNPGFEQDLEGWSLERANEENVQVTAEAAASGEKGLHLKDTDSNRGYRVVSSPLEVQPGMAYSVTFQGLSTGAAGGIGVEMIFRGYGGETLQPVNIPRFWPAVTINPMSAFTGHRIKAIAPEGASSMVVVIRSFSGPGAEVMLDDFAVTPHPSEAQETPP